MRCEVGLQPVQSLRGQGLQSVQSVCSEWRCGIEQMLCSTARGGIEGKSLCSQEGLQPVQPVRGQEPVQSLRGEKPLQPLCCEEPMQPLCSEEPMQPLRGGESV